MSETPICSVRGTQSLKSVGLTSVDEHQAAEDLNQLLRIQVGVGGKNIWSSAHR